MIQKMDFTVKVPVCLTACPSYESAALLSAMQEQLDILGVPSSFSGKKVLLKPNLISAGVPALACSSPLFTAAAAACFSTRGARVLLGDSPAFGSAAQVLKRQGFAPVFSGGTVEHLVFRTRVVRTLDCGIKVGVAREALDCDLFVNLPRIKAHDQMGVTMAVKNVFGIVLGSRKAWLHMRHGESHQLFSRMILDLQKILPPALVVADGIEVMTGRGPVHGEPLGLGCLGASKSAVALDRAMLEVLEVDRKGVPLVLAAEREGCAGSFLEDLEYPQCTPDMFAGSGFTVPEELSPVRFLHVRYIRGCLKRIFSA